MAPDYQRIVQVLKDRLGSRFEGGEADGREDIRAVLRDELGLSRKDADDVVEALLESGQLRWRAGDGAGVFPAAGVVGTPSSTGTGSAPGIPAAAVIGMGHWEVGDAGEGSGRGAESLTRAGQVDPTA